MMPSPFELVILRLRELGFFSMIIPFILTSAILYALLRKSQLFGPPEKNAAVNAIIAITASFMVWAAPVIVGINIEEMLMKFLLQSFLASIVVLVVLLIVGMFVGPDLPSKISQKYVGVLIIGSLVVGLILVLSSGFLNVFFPGGAEGMGISEDVIISIATIFILLIVVGAVIAFVSREEKKK